MSMPKCDVTIKITNLHNASIDILLAMDLLTCVVTLETMNLDNICINTNHYVSLPHKPRI